MASLKLKIGFCSDLAGPYEDVDGLGGADAIRLAIEDAQLLDPGLEVDLLLGDHRNDIDTAARITTNWLTQGAVDLVISGVNSDTSLAITKIAATHSKPVFVVGAGTSVQAREQPSPLTVQYAYSTVALGTVPGLALTRSGLRDWFFVTADYPFGRELQTHAATAIQSAGGRVVGSMVNPRGADDFTPYLRQAEASGAQVLALANGHAELLKAVVAMKQMNLSGKMKVVGLLTFFNDIHAMGLEEAKGIYCADSWFWTRDDASRQWAKRFMQRSNKMPSSLQAADYSAAFQYMKAVTATGSKDPHAVINCLRNSALDDMFVHDARIRQDGSLLHEFYLLRVRSPNPLIEPWDYYDLIETVDGEDALPLP